MISRYLLNPPKAFQRPTTFCYLSNSLIRYNRLSLFAGAKVIILLFSLQLVLLCPQKCYSIYVDPRLETVVRTTATDEFIPINIIMESQADNRFIESQVKGFAIQQRRDWVVNYLKSFSADTQAELIGFLHQQAQAGKAKSIRPLWIVNVVHAKVTPDVIQMIKPIPGISAISYEVKQLVLPDVFDTNDGTIRANNPFVPPHVSASTDTAWGLKWINVPPVWKQGYRGEGILIAELDTGIDYYHSDLRNNIWHNPGETPNNGKDDDNNGYVDDYYGYDFALHTSNPYDDHGHGTHVAGTIVGDGTGGTITGVAPEATVMALKVLEYGYGEESEVWEAIQYACDNGAQLMSLSIGWNKYFHEPTRASWRQACNNALSIGVVMCVAAGNERGWFNPPDVVRTPGDCPPPWRNPDQAEGGLSAVITVGATGYKTNSYAYFSSNGPVSWQDEPPYYDYPYNPGPGLTDPDICAPGEAVNSTIKGGGYSGDSYAWSGTSMATPHTSGVVALMLCKELTLTPAEIDCILETTAIDLGTPGKDNDYGAGRIDALAAVDAIVDIPDSIPPIGPTTAWGWSSDGHELSLESENWYNYTTPHFHWDAAVDTTTGVSGYAVSFSTVPNDTVDFANFQTDTTFTNQQTLQSDLMYYLRVRAKDRARNWNTARTLFMYKFDNITPQNPDSIWSPFHTPRIWSDNFTIEVNWTQATELTGSGVTGYSCLWDTNTYTLPDTIKELEQSDTTYITTLPYENDNWWFHLRVGDNAGNWNDTALHLGPYWIFSSPVTVELSPDTTVLTHGDSVTIEITLANHTYQQQKFQLWTEAILPNNRSYLLYSPTRYKLTGLTTLKVYVTHTVPDNAPTGDYTYVAYIGTYPSNILDDAQFEFNIISTTLCNKTNDIVLYRVLPNNEPVNLGYSTTKNIENTPIKVYNITGQLIQHNFWLSSTIDDYAIERYKSFITYKPIRDNATGIYFVRIETDTKVLIKPIVIIR